MLVYSSPVFTLDGHIEYSERNGSHIAFPDVVNFCDHEVLAFREALTHAADKGLVRLILDPIESSKVLTFEDNNYDLRNPYFHQNSLGLFLYITIFDYGNHEFVGTREFQIFDSKCNLDIKKTLEFDHIIYAPRNSSLASYSKSTNNILSLVDQKVFATAPNLGVKTRVFDEEISFFKDIDSDSVYGVGRNQKDTGKPLLIYELKNDSKLIYKFWCGSLYDSALVSPKVYIDESAYYVSYSSRRLINDEGAYSSKNQLGIHWMSFQSQSALLNCNPSYSYGLYFKGDIDGGYQAYNEATDRLFFYARLYNNEEFNIYYINDFLGKLKESQ